MKYNRIYRGVNIAGTWLHGTRTAISFTTREMAVKYAFTDVSPMLPAETPRLYCGDIEIAAPFVVLPTTSHLPVEQLVRLVGGVDAFYIAEVLANAMQTTPEWTALREEHKLEYAMMFQFRRYERFLWKLTVPLDALVQSDKCVAILRKKGFDGAIYQHNFKDIDHTVFAVFDDTQITDANCPEYLH